MDKAEKKEKHYAQLLEAAHTAMERALANSSGFKVGAALSVRGGKVYYGGNIETTTSKLGICAERVVLFKALSEGEREFDVLAVVAASGQLCPPCGVCRQVLWEFSPDLTIILSDEKGKMLVKKIEDFLPMPFDRGTFQT